MSAGCWATKTSCGTAACLAGWLASDPRIKAEGLHLVRLDDKGPAYQPRYDKIRGMYALTWFLDISLNEAHSIFGSEYPNSFTHALGRLRRVESGEFRRRFIADDEAEGDNDEENNVDTPGGF